MLRLVSEVIEQTLWKTSREASFTTHHLVPHFYNVFIAVIESKVAERKRGNVNQCEDNMKPVSVVARNFSPLMHIWKSLWWQLLWGFLCVCVYKWSFLYKGAISTWYEALIKYNQSCFSSHTFSREKPLTVMLP